MIASAETVWLVARRKIHIQAASRGGERNAAMPVDDRFRHSRRSTCVDNPQRLIEIQPFRLKALTRLRVRGHGFAKLGVARHVHVAEAAAVENERRKVRKGRTKGLDDLCAVDPTTGIEDAVRCDQDFRSICLKRSMIAWAPMSGAQTLQIAPILVHARSATMVSGTFGMQAATRSLWRTPRRRKAAAKDATRRRNSRHESSATSPDSLSLTIARIPARSVAST